MNLRTKRQKKDLSMAALLRALVEGLSCRRPRGRSDRGPLCTSHQTTPDPPSSIIPPEYTGERLVSPSSQQRVTNFRVSLA